jgi:hypothetical protein
VVLLASYPPYWQDIKHHNIFRAGQFAFREGQAGKRLTVRRCRQPNAVFCGHMYAYLLLSMLMKRTALFLKEQQLEKLQTLSEKTGAPVAELVRRAIDAYLLSRRKELK